MITVLMEMTAAEHRADLRRTADRSRSVAGTRHDEPSRIEIRQAAADDLDATILTRLSALDDQPPITAPALIASHDGRAIAAIELQSERVVADPFARTADAVVLLQQRSEQLTESRARRRLRLHIPRLRLA